LVTSPDGKIKAQALVTFSKGFEGVHSGRPDELFHVLAVESGGTTHEVELASFGGARLSPQPPGEYRAAVHATMTVQLAADGHAASVSSDGGKSFEHVVLDAGDPFLCGVDSPASEAPPTRELVLAGLKSKGILRHGDARATCDIGGATRVLCAARTDAELWLAAVEMLVDAELVDAERDPLMRCAQSVAKENEAIRAALVAAMARSDAGLENGAEALAKSDDADTQSKLAGAARSIGDRAPLPTNKCWRRAKIVWSLASITVDRRAAPADARQLLVDVARGDDVCPSELTGKAARVYAVAALAALDDATLDDLAAKCSGAAEKWSVPFAAWNEAMTSNLVAQPLECLAKAARAK
jgi:hypothetical protein